MAKGIRLLESEAPRAFVNSGRTGFFDIVELNIANIPVPHNSINGENNLFFIDPPLIIHYSYGSRAFSGNFATKLATFSGIVTHSSVSDRQTMINCLG